MSTQPRQFPWETGELQLARADCMACAYNAAVNYGTGRGHRKMRELIDAINRYQRAEGAAKLRWLVDRGVVDSFRPCPPGCQMRPGGLFHEPGCENDTNSDVAAERRRRAEDVLPAWQTAAAWPSLVGR